MKRVWWQRCLEQNYRQIPVFFPRISLLIKGARIPNTDSVLVTLICHPIIEKKSDADSEANILSSTTELEELQNEKAQLQRILQSLQEEERYLEKRLRMVEEEMAIQVLKEMVRARRVVVEQLEFKKRDLEKRLKEPQGKPESFPMAVTVSAAHAGNQQLRPSEERQEQPRRNADLLVGCPYLSDSERKCSLMRKHISIFDYEHYCNDKPASCYHYRKAESQKTKTSGCTPQV